MEKTSYEAVERVARIYHTNQGASHALGITIQAFARLCREYGIQTPYKRRLNARRMLKAQED